MRQYRGKWLGCVVACVVGGHVLAAPEVFSIKKAPCNVRSGPTKNHPVQWVITKAPYPVEATAFSHDWVRVADSDGQLGWIHKPMLSKKEGALFVEDTELKHKKSSTSAIVARVKEGVLATRVKECQKKICRVMVVAEGKTLEGFAPQSHLWPQKNQ